MRRWAYRSHLYKMRANTKARVSTTRQAPGSTVTRTLPNSSRHSRGDHRAHSCARKAGRARLLWIALVLTALGAHTGGVRAQGTDPADQVCQRFQPGAQLQDPPDLRSQNGVLEVTLVFKQVVDQQGLSRFCYVSDTGLEAPTLHVYPGDQLIIHLQNTLTAPTGGSSMPAGMRCMPTPRRGRARSVRTMTATAGRWDLRSRTCISTA